VVESDEFEDEAGEPDVESPHAHHAPHDDLPDLSQAEATAPDPEPLTEPLSEPDADPDVQVEMGSYASTGDGDVDGDADGEDAIDIDEDTFDPYAQYDETDEDDTARSVAVVPVDSELPDGVELPGTGEAAITYPHAAPGVPLDTRGVPVEVWAPELDPRVRAAIDEAEAASQSA
jgi:hypothetical protein